MPIKRTTKEEFKRIMDGMLFHCMDLTKFMAEKVDDPWFETEQGKRMRKLAVDICAKHAMASMEFMMDGFKANKDKDEGDDNKIDFEQILKDML